MLWKNKNALIISITVFMVAVLVTFWLLFYKPLPPQEVYGLMMFLLPIILGCLTMIIYRLYEGDGKK